jgi:asparagine synthase (glutamine-hydrolysing)
MSGFVGVLHTDGTRADTRELRRLTEAMAYCGPDHQDVWVDGHVGLGHALLGATPAPAKHERQPCSVDGRTWIAADARIDGRTELAAALSARRPPVAPGEPDAHLILHAYAMWGERCVEHLIGDFAFAIWDADRHRLFCARDHFGVVPLYYAPVPEGIVFGNVLRSLRLHPKVSSVLDERAIGDFLLFGVNMDPTSTTFTQIRAVPPAHTLTVEDGDARLRRYWEPPDDRELRLERPAEYVERFQVLFDQAVRDRLRVARAGTHLSGGMDSGSVAATAQAILRSRGGDVDLRAYTVVFDELIAEQEGPYAELVAEWIEIPRKQVIADQCMTRHPGADPKWVFPEPAVIACQSPEYEISRRVASFSRALLVGYGGDPLLRTPASSWWRERANTTGRALRAGRLPRYGVRTAARRALASRRAAATLPDWIEPAFASRAELRERWAEVWSQWGKVGNRRELQHPLWATIFGRSHPGASGLPLRVLFPFFDLRLAEYVWRTPRASREDKRLLRDAMSERLPPAIVERPKALLYTPTGTEHADDPWHLIALRPDTRRWRAALLEEPAIAEYVDVARALPRVETPIARRTLPAFDNVFALAHWMQSLAEPPQTTKEPPNAPSSIA